MIKFDKAIAPGGSNQLKDQPRTHDSSNSVSPTKNFTKTSQIVEVAKLLKTKSKLRK